MHVLVRTPSESTSSTVHVQSLHTPSPRDERNETGRNASHCRAIHLVECTSCCATTTCSARSPSISTVATTEARAASCTHHRAQSARRRCHTRCRYSVIKRAFRTQSAPTPAAGTAPAARAEHAPPSPPDSTRRRHPRHVVHAVVILFATTVCGARRRVRGSAVRHISAATSLAPQRVDQVFWAQLMDNPSSRAGVYVACGMLCSIFVLCDSS